MINYIHAIGNVLWRAAGIPFWNPRSLGALSTISYVLDKQYPVADGIAETISSGNPVESSLLSFLSRKRPVSSLQTG